MKVLIIDDNAAVRMSLKMVLADEFDEILALGDPRLIPALLKAGDIDAALLDMNFNPDNLDGHEGLFWLERIKSTPMAPAVVMITAFGDVPLAVEAMKNGAEDFVTKPWDNVDLIAKVHNAIAKNRLQRKITRTVSYAAEIEDKEQRRRRLTLEKMKQEHVREVVDICGGNLSAAARTLGINRQTLYNIIKSMSDKK